MNELETKKMKSAEKALIAMKLELDKKQKEYDEMKKEMFQYMENNQILSYKTENCTVGYNCDTTVERFDAKAFKEDYPEIYDEYLKTEKRKGYATFRVKITNINDYIDSNPDVLQLKHE